MITHYKIIWYAQTQHGFALLPVAIVIAVIASIALLISSQSAMNVNNVASQNEKTEVKYLAQAALEHATWVANNSGCAGYSLPVTSLGQNSYAATYTPAGDSPVTIAATGTLSNGVTHTITETNIPVYNPTTQTVTLQPGPEGDDAEIWAQAPNNNYGDSAETWVSSASNDTTRSLLSFNMDTIPVAAKVLDATLSLRRQSGSGGSQPVSAHRIRNQWSEDSVTWNSREPGTNWDMAGGDFEQTPITTTQVGPANDRYEWNITPLVQVWVDGSYPNYGVALVAAIAGMSGERFHTSDDADVNKHPSLSVTYACECGVPCDMGTEISIDPIILATQDQATLVGSTFEDDDLAEYDPITNTAAQYFAGTLFSGNEDIKALHVLDNGHIALSTSTNATLGGLTFKNGDVVDYDPIADTATLLFSEDTDAGIDIDIDALHILDNRHIIFSVDTAVTIAFLTVHDGDLIEWDPDTGNFSLYFDHNAFTTDANVDGFHLLDNGHMIFSTTGTETLGGLTFEDGDLVDYDPIAGTATLYFSEVGHFDADEDINAVFIEEPFPALNVLMVVSESSSPDSVDVWRSDLLESWGYTVELIDDSDGQAAFDVAVTNNDVAYVSGTTVHSELQTKLVNVTIGVVKEVPRLVQEFGFSSGNELKDRDEIDIVDNAHYITTLYKTGLLTVYSGGVEPSYMLINTLASDLQTLGLMSEAGPTWSPALTVLNTGATLYSGGTATGRRVALPWENLDFSSLNVDGQTLLRRALEWGSGIGDEGSATEPIAHWKLDETSGTTAVDSVGGHDGTVSGASWTTGQDAGALDFDGSNDTVNLTSDTELDDVFSEGATAMAWIRPTSTGESGYGRILDKTSDLGTGNRDGWYLILSPSGNLEFMQGFSGDRGIWETGSDTISLDTWQHVAIAYDNSVDTNDPLIYIDGVAQTVIESNTPSGTLRSDASIDLTLGNHPGSTQRTFDGQIDDVRLYDRLLDATEVSEVTTGGGGGGSGCDGNFRDEFNTDASYSGSDGTLSWATDWLEVNESDGPDSGDERVRGDSGNDYTLRVRDNDNGGEGVQREADLSAYTNANLRFAYRRDSLDNSSDYVTIDISSNGGSSWVEIDRIEGPGDDSSYQPLTHDISSFISSNTRIRFKTSSSNGGNDEVYFDDVEISVSGCAE